MRTARATEPGGVSERLIIFLVGAIQFVNIVDFMMVMPLGPDYARALGKRVRNREREATPIAPSFPPI